MMMNFGQEKVDQLSVFFEKPNLDTSGQIGCSFCAAAHLSSHLCRCKNTLPNTDFFGAREVLWADNAVFF